MPSDSKANVKKGDFVFLVKEKDQINSQEYLKVDHDDVPHGLMMKIHEMHDMKGM